jgi:hypothetical protein
MPVVASEHGGLDVLRVTSNKIRCGTASSSSAWRGVGVNFVDVLQRHGAALRP